MRYQASIRSSTSTRKRQRRRAFVLALLWLFGWAAATLQPCCEALAAVIPHHLETLAAPEHERDDHAIHHDDGPPSKDHHSHCPTATPVDLGNPAPVPAAIGNGDKVRTPLYLPAARVARLPLTPQPTVLLPRYGLPPPISVPPFLVQRLLI
jgi:hypothetical protein